MLKATKMIVGVFGLSFIASAAFAGDGHSASAFEMIDKDGDGAISMQEAETSQGLSESWKTLDKDENGNLDVSEFSAFEETAAEPVPATAPN